MLPQMPKLEISPVLVPNSLSLPQLEKQEWYYLRHLPVSSPTDWFWEIFLFSCWNDELWAFGNLMLQDIEPCLWIVVHSRSAYENGVMVGKNGNRTRCLLGSWWYKQAWEICWLRLKRWFFSLVFGMNFMVNSRETGNFIIFLLGPLNGWDSVGKYVDCAWKAVFLSSWNELYC